MATYRNIQLSFWTDSKVADDFTPEDKYFYLYLLTNPHTNTCGCYELSIKQMSVETGYSMETVQRLIDRFALVHGVIRYSRENKELLLLNWHKYNWTTSYKLRISIYNAIKPIKTKSFKEFLLNHFDGEGDEEEPDMDSDEKIYPIDRVLKNNDTLSEPRTDEQTKANDKKEKLKKHKEDVEELFERVWSIYIRKEGKNSVTKAAKEEIYNLGYDVMERCIQNYARQKAGNDKKYILMGSTFFNGRYKDYMVDEPGDEEQTTGQVRRALQ